MKHNLRTKSGRRAEIIERVKRDGGLNHFWIAENQRRSATVEAMIASGELDLEPVGFPNLKATVKVKGEE